jgi:predicted secreted Zn-dependent protease
MRFAVLLLGIAACAGEAAGADDCAAVDGSSPHAVLVTGGDGVAPDHLLRFELREQHCVHAFDARDEGELDRQLAERAINGSPRWHGLTRATFDVRFELEPATAGCRFAWLDLQVDISVWLPQWQQSGPVRQREGARWRARLATLQEHERTHRDQMVDAAVALYREFGRLEAVDCQRFDQLARQRIDRALLRLKLKGESFDALTDHGRRRPPSR